MPIIILFPKNGHYYPTILIFVHQSNVFSKRYNNWNRMPIIFYLSAIPNISLDESSLTRHPINKNFSIVGAVILYNGMLTGA